MSYHTIIKEDGLWHNIKSQHVASCGTILAVMLRDEVDILDDDYSEILTEEICEKCFPDKFGRIPLPPKMDKDQFPDDSKTIPINEEFAMDRATEQVEVLQELDALIAQADGSLKFDGQAIRCDSALARNLEWIKDYIKRLYAATP
jgi:hypothetical protein